MLPRIDLGLSLAFEHTATATALVDAKQRILATNTAMCELVGLAKREVVTRSLTDMLGSKVESETGGWQHILAARTPAQFECSLTTRTDKAIWVRVDVRPLPPQGRSVAAAVVTLYDITERKQALERHAEMQARVEMAFEVGRTALWIWDLDTDEIALDDLAKSWLGYAPDEMRRRTDWLTKLHPDDIAALTGLGESIARDVPQSFEFVARIATKSGDFCSLLARGHAVRSPQGDVRCIVGLAVDISERTQTLELLQEQQQRFARAALAGRVSVYDYDLTTGIIYTDPAFNEILGLGTSVGLSHDSLVKYLHPGDKAQVLAHEAAALEATAKTDEHGNTPSQTLNVASSPTMGRSSGCCYAAQFCGPRMGRRIV